MADAVESALTGDDRGIAVGSWNELVRRARIGREHKLAALTFSSYAEPNGTKIHCGTARFALDCEVSYATARRYLAWLRRVGLVEKVGSGNKRRGLSDEYRLILGEDLLEHIDLPDPDQYKKMRDEIRTVNREGSARRSRRVREGRTGDSDGDLRSPRAGADHIDGGAASAAPSALIQVSAEGTCHETDLRSTNVSAETRDLRSFEPRSALTQDEHPPIRNTSPEVHTSPLRGNDLRPGVTATRARGPEERDFPSSRNDPERPDGSALTAAAGPAPVRRHPRLRGTRLGCGTGGCVGGALVVSETELAYCPHCYVLDPDDEPDPNSTPRPAGGTA